MYSNVNRGEGRPESTMKDVYPFSIDEVGSVVQKEWDTLKDKEHIKAITKTLPRITNG